MATDTGPRPVQNNKLEVPVPVMKINTLDYAAKSTITRKIFLCYISIISCLIEIEKKGKKLFFLESQWP
jgi:hypothetical protein